MRRKKNIYYYKARNDREIDFVVKEGERITELIQVCYTLEDPQTRKREIDALKAAIKELSERARQPIQCTILTMDKSQTIDLDVLNVDIRNIIDWLLFP